MTIWKKDKQAHIMKNMQDVCISLTMPLWLIAWWWVALILTLVALVNWENAFRGNDIYLICAVLFGCFSAFGSVWAFLFRISICNKKVVQRKWWKTRDYHLEELTQVEINQERMTLLFGEYKMKIYPELKDSKVATKYILGLAEEKGIWVISDNTLHK